MTMQYDVNVLGADSLQFLDYITFDVDEYQEHSIKGPNRISHTLKNVQNT